MIGGRSALLSAASGPGYGNWTGNYEDVSLLLRGYGTPALVPLDESSTPKTVTTLGNAAFITNLSKYGSSSLRLGGSPDTLSIPKLGLISTDFTIEFWIYLLDGGVASQIVCTTYNAPTQLNTFSVSRSSPGNIIAFLDPFGVGSTSTALPLATWTHIACVYIHSTRNYRIFVNGIGSTSATGTAITAEAANFFIGGSPGDNNIGTLYLNALIDDFRVTKLARYTSNFTPPTAELPANITDDPNYNDVSLLLRTGTPTGPLVPTDESPTPKGLAIVGSARISTTVFKYGGSALVAGNTPSFSWGAGRLEIAPSLAFAYGTGDYTVEAWIYPTGFGNNTFNQGSIMLAQLAPNVNYFICAYRPGSTSSFVRFAHVWATSGEGVTAYSPDLPRNQWSHVAVVRSNGQVKVYGNGVSGSPVSNTQDFTNTTYPVYVGSAGTTTTTSQFEGYIDDLRVTKGVARYTKNFLPPPAELPAI